MREWIMLRVAQSGAMEENYYSLFGLEKTATEIEIKEAYTKLIIQYNSEMSTLPPEKANSIFYHIQEAYNVLLDPSKRELYDQHQQSLPKIYKKMLDELMEYPEQFNAQLISQFQQYELATAIIKKKIVELKVQFILYLSTIPVTAFNQNEFLKFEIYLSNMLKKFSMLKKINLDSDKNLIPNEIPKTKLELCVYIVEFYHTQFTPIYDFEYFIRLLSPFIHDSEKGEISDLLIIEILMNSRIEKNLYLAIQMLENQLGHTDWITRKYNEVTLFANALSRHHSVFIHFYLKYLYDKDLLIQILPELLSQIATVKDKKSDVVNQRLMFFVNLICDLQYSVIPNKVLINEIVLDYLALIGKNGIFEHMCRKLKPDMKMIDNIFISNIQNKKFQVFEYIYLRSNNSDIYQPSQKVIQAMLDFAIDLGDYLFIKNVSYYISKNKESDKALLLEKMIKSALINLLQSYNLMDIDIQQHLHALNYQNLYNFYCVIISFHKGKLLTDHHPLVPLETKIKLIKFYVMNPDKSEYFTENRFYRTKAFFKNSSYKGKVDNLNVLFQTKFFSHYFDFIIQSKDNILYSNANTLYNMEKEGLLNEFTCKILMNYSCYYDDFQTFFMNLHKSDLLNNENYIHYYKNIDIHACQIINKQIKNLEKSNLSQTEYKIQIMALIIAQYKNLLNLFIKIDDYSVRSLLYGEDLITEIILKIMNHIDQAKQKSIACLLIELQQIKLIELMQKNLEQFYYSDLLPNRYSSCEDIYRYIYQVGQTLLTLKAKKLFDLESVKFFLSHLPINYHQCEAINQLPAHYISSYELLDMILVDYKIHVKDISNILTARDLLFAASQPLSVIQIKKIIAIIETLKRANIICSYIHLVKSTYLCMANIDEVLLSLTNLAQHECLTDANWFKLANTFNHDQGRFAYSISCIMIKHPHLIESINNDVGLICHALVEIENHTDLPVSEHLVVELQKNSTCALDVAKAFIDLQSNHIPMKPMDILTLLVRNGLYAKEVAITLNVLAKSDLLQSEFNILDNIFDYPNSSVEKGKALVQLQHANLLNNKFKSLILNSQYRQFVPTHIAWAIVKLNEADLLKKTKLNNEDILIVSQIKLKNSPLLIDFVIFMLKQILYLEQTKKYYSYYLMIEKKITAKLDEYRLKMNEIAALTSENEMIAIANHLLTNPILNQTCNVFGYSLFHSADVMQLTHYINNHFHLTSSNEIVGEKLLFINVI